MRVFLTFTVDAEIEFADGRRANDSTLCRFTTSRGRRQAIRNAERRIMRRNPDWRRIDWHFNPAPPAREAQ